MRPIQTTLVQFLELKELIEKNPKIRIKANERLLINKIDSKPLSEIPYLKKKIREQIDQLLQQVKMQLLRSSK